MALTRNEALFALYVAIALPLSSIGPSFSALLHVVLIRTNRIEEYTITKGVAGGLKVAHLSDLHLSAGPTLEAGLPASYVYDRAKKTLEWALARADLVAVTGDFTDDGSKEQWEIFARLLRETCDGNADRVLLVPGNHDLSLSTLQLPVVAGVPPDFEWRCGDYVRSILSNAPGNWQTMHEGRLVPVRSILDEAGPYLAEYFTERPTGKLVRYRVTQQVLVTDVPQRTRDAALRNAREIWPKAGTPLCADLLEEVFPVVFFADAQVVVIGLNSCSWGGLNIYGGGWGVLGGMQLPKLRAILERFRDRTPIICLHHHVGFPRPLHAQLRRKISWLQMKALQLVDAPQFGALLAEFSPAVLLHGHKHMSYSARFGGGIVLSAPSVAYGDALGGQVSARVYCVQKGGAVSIDSEFSYVPPGS